MWSNLLRFVGDGITVHELVAAVGLPKRSVLSRVGGVERWRYVSFGPSTAKREGYGSARAMKDEYLVQFTPAGRRAAGIWPVLPGEIEARWRERFGAAEIDELGGALRAVDERIDTALPEYLPIVSSTHGMALEVGQEKRQQGDDLPLVVLLAHALMAYTLDFEESSALSLPLSANVFRVLDGEGMPVRELPSLTGISKEAVEVSLTSLAKTDYVVVEGAPASKRKIRLTPAGETLRSDHRRLHARIGKRWADAVRRERRRAAPGRARAHPRSPGAPCRVDSVSRRLAGEQTVRTTDTGSARRSARAAAPLPDGAAPRRLAGRQLSGVRRGRDLGVVGDDAPAYSSSVQARAVVGRDAELAVVEEFLTLASEASATLVVEGEPGIGKTTLWQEAVRRADERGMRVLSSRPGPSETRLTFVALGDFLAAVDSGILSELPPPQLRALDVALLRSDPEGSAPEQRAVATAFLSVLRLLSLASPVVVAVDDLQWLDTSSRRVLEFAMRRLSSEPVGFLGTVRLDGSAGQAVAVEWVRRARLSPLTLAALHEILKDELGRTFPRPTLVRIERTSSGNPLFALELARALVEQDEPVRGSGPLPVPGDLTELIAGRLRRLSATTRDALLVASALPQPTLDVLDRDAIARAEAAGVVRVDQQRRVFFTHPLLAMSVYGSATESRRREVHRELADRVVDPEERARHLALAAEVPDEAVAHALAEAAQAARDRGAADAAIELLELACDLTPPDREDALYPRRLELGRYLAEAGDPERAGSMLRDVAENALLGPLRARALLLLAFGSETSDAGEVATDLCEQALGHAGDDVDLRTEILAAASRMYDFDVERKVTYAQAAMELAERGGASAQLQAYALLAFAEAEFFAGRGISYEAFDRAAELESDAALDGGLRPARATHRVHHYSDIRPSARLLGILQIYADELDAARREFEVEREVALEHGDEVQLGRTLIRLAIIELRAGDWNLADRHLQEASSVLERTKQEALRRWMLATAASLDTLRGRVDEARDAGERALALATYAGAHWQIGECHAALGLLDLSLDHLTAAAANFDRASEINDHIGPKEPRLLRFQADHIETLVALGELDRAATALERLEQQGQATASAWALATGARCRGLVCSALGDLDGAARSLEQALVEHERLPIPFERGRTLLAAGQVHRRRNERRLARDALTRSIATFEELGSPLWAEKAHAEIRRLGLRRSAPDELTATEETVASLAASGLRNREIAERMFVSPKTVEANLSRVYRKLGIHSRAELGARMAERERLTKT